VSKVDKLKNRLLSRPADFTWQELCTLMNSFGFRLEQAGGSGRKFIHSDGDVTLFLHEPHPGSILKAYQVRSAIALLKAEEYL
jgi:predicted RNA binding protein YcfA (HicA-like mRNA interferase family)